LTFDTYLHLVDTLGQADVQRKPDGLGAVVDENGTDRHAGLPTQCYIANVYGAVRWVKLTPAK
jgi:hypothetical protein